MYRSSVDDGADDDKVIGDDEGPGAELGPDAGLDEGVDVGLKDEGTDVNEATTGDVGVEENEDDVDGTAEVANDSDGLNEGLDDGLDEGNDGKWEGNDGSDDGLNDGAVDGADEVVPIGDRDDMDLVLEEGLRDSVTDGI